MEKTRPQPAARSAAQLHRKQIKGQNVLHIGKKEQWFFTSTHSPQHRSAQTLTHHAIGKAVAGQSEMLGSGGEQKLIQ